MLFVKSHSQTAILNTNPSEDLGILVLINIRTLINTHFFTHIPLPTPIIVPAGTQHLLVELRFSVHSRWK